MFELCLTIVFSIVNLAVPYAVTRRDRRKLSPVELVRAWNTPSWACAIFFFGPLCLPAHFWVTRRTLRGALIGIAWAAGTLSAEWLASAGLELARAG